MRNMRNSSLQFEQLIVELFHAMGKKNIELNKVVSEDGFEADIKFGDDGDMTVVEIKNYRVSSPPNPDLLVNSLKKLALVRHQFSAQRSILVVSCHLSKTTKELLDLGDNVEIWDLARILEEAEKFPDISQKITALLEISTTDKIQTGDHKLVRTNRSENLPGKNLALKLKALRPGRKSAYDFESLCIECLKYLFSDDLVGWKEQNETIDRLHRRDLICRVKSKAEIWKFISENLSSRYVVFEFKNYSKKITQHEIITTERYLYPTALRRTAIVISQKGCADSALKVIEGAMREHGKLIISLTTNEICDLLNGKDVGDDANTFLFDKVDEFLMGLSR